MTDREILEFAAKAAGIKCRWWKVKEWAPTSYVSGAMRGRMFKGNKDVFGTHHRKPWNPLEDDGDAFRLSVKLESAILRIDGGVCGCVKASDLWAGLVDQLDQDQNRAARRAITRAAAEIGKRMP